MTVFVTGSTGLLGGNLVELLLDHGYKVKALVRSETNAPKTWIQRGVEIILGDITASASFADALSGCDVVYHCAAYHKEYSGPGDHATTLKKVNVDGTMGLIDTCRLQGVYHVVFVSSNGVTGPAADGIPANEDSGFDEQTDNLYFKSKIEAEKAIDRYLARHQEMRIDIIRPGLMIGPGDRGPTPAGKVILKFLQQKMPFILPGNIVVVDARDVAAAMIASAERTSGVRGERFIIGGQKYTMAQYAETLAAVSGVKVPGRRPPFPVALFIITFASFVSRLTGHSFPVTPMDLRRIRRLEAPDSGKARKILNVRFRSLAESLGDAVGWFRTNGNI